MSYWISSVHSIRRHLHFGFGVIACLALLGCSGGDEFQAGGGANPQSDGSRQPQSENGMQADVASAPVDDRYAQKDDQKLVRIKTTVGNIDVRLDTQAAPSTVRNFLAYAINGHYKGTVFHYVQPGQMILGGGITADGQERPTDVPIRNEAHNGKKNQRGTLAMARDANVIDSATSQFFINLNDAPHLDHVGDEPGSYGYCVFGEVVAGLDIAQRIATAPTKHVSIGDEQIVSPATPVVIEDVTVLR